MLRITSLARPLLLLPLLVTALQGASATAARPNIVFIMSDDIGYGDLGCYGATHVKTPHLDRLAREGLRFTDAHSTATVCTPTRYAFLTGRYAWRDPGTGIAAGDRPALISAGTPTVPSLLKQAGYTTGMVGKWHLGLGEPPKTDFNRAIKPGPLEIGFDYAFYMPSTGDRVPCVLVENHHVVGFDPADPIQVSYGKKIGTEPVATDPGVTLKIKGARGHDEALVNGIGRIGYMTGGHAARWIDEDLADTLTARAVGFIERSATQPFFLFLATHDIHEPMVPHPRFRGTSGIGWRGDVIHQLDWTVGQVLATLDRLKLADNTLIIFTSDNGGAIKDTYDDGTNHLHSRQRPNGPLRGQKGTLYEGGHRVPFLARWPARMPAGADSAHLLSTVDLFATFAHLANQPLPAHVAPDSFDLHAALLGQPKAQGRDHLVLQNGGPAALALREGDWVLVEAPPRRQSAAQPPRAELYNLATDLGQKTNLAAEQRARAEAMATRLRAIRQSTHTRPGYTPLKP
jgi:arylsulfatase A-like enzyme